MTCEMVTNGPEKWSAIESFFVVPVETHHGVLRLQDLLCCCLEGKHVIRGIIDFSDLVPF